MTAVEPMVAENAAPRPERWVPERWVIITAPTDRGADPRDEVLPAVEMLREWHPNTQFRVAVLGGVGDTITVMLDEAAAAGASEVVVVSAQTVTDRKIDVWFRRVIGHWLRERAAEPALPEAPPVRLAGALSGGVDYANLLEAAIIGPTTAARDTTAPLTSPAWEKIPGFARHVLVCRGPRCSARGGPEATQALNAALERRGLGDNDVLVSQAGCLFPCSQAPVVVVYPDNTWYDGVDADRMERLVDQHLVGGEPITEWLGARTGSA